jgi:release factor glutamine methyltransferase
MKIKSNKISDIRQCYLKELSEIYEQQESVVFLDLIFEEFLGLSRVERVLNTEKRATESEILKIHFAVKDLKQHKPIQYILKKTEFYGLPYYVDERVLIPRPETEELVSWVLEFFGQEVNCEILDIGTGSGCIAISIKKNLISANVWAMDVSPLSLEVARMNAISNHVDIHFLLQDILESHISENLPPFDAIVSNPPYVRNSEKLLMQKNVLDYEPALALFVEDNDPLKFYRVIAEFSKKYLKPGGTLFFEINEALAAETVGLLESMGFSDIIVKQDIHNKNRMIKAKKS